MADMADPERLALSRPRPVPSDMSKFSRTTCGSVGVVPSGTITAVSDGE